MISSYDFSIAKPTIGSWERYVGPAVYLGFVRARDGAVRGLNEIVVQGWHLALSTPKCMLP